MITNSELDRLRRLGLIKHFEDNEALYLDKIRTHINTAKYATNGVVTKTTINAAACGFRDELITWPIWLKVIERALFWDPSPDPFSAATTLCKYIFSNHSILKKLNP